MLGLRAAQWRNSLTRVGLTVPFWLVHDLGLLTVIDPASIPIGPRPVNARLDEAELREYASVLKEIAESEVLEKARQWRLEDSLIAVLLLKVLGPLHEHYLNEVRAKLFPANLPLDPEVYRDIEPELGALFAGADRTHDVGFLRFLLRRRLRLITSVEQVDLDTLKLVGMFGSEASAASAMQMLDLLNVFQSPDANDIVNFSLDLLPSVLETKRASGQQRFSVDGYAGVSRRGTLDSLVLSELAFDEELFDRRFVEKEVFFYAREKQHEEDRKLHYILVDASASMRGRRSVFARGLALTLVKKLSLQGEDVYFRFFDSRLYDVQTAKAGKAHAAGISVPYVLCFKGERGRNYPKVFGALVSDLERLKRREGRMPIVYVLTHAECHLPLETVERLRNLAKLYGVFMLPSSGELELEYVHRLHTVQVVDEQSLIQKDARARRALEIVDDAAAGDDEAAKKREPDARERASMPEIYV